MKVYWSKILTSKTVWLGVLMCAAAIVEYIIGLPPGTSIAQGIFGALTIIIRFLTNDALIEKGR